MKVTKKQADDILTFAKQFRNESIKTISESKMRVPNTILKYAKAKVLENKNVTVTKKIALPAEDAEYILEVVDNTYYLTRIIGGNTGSRYDNIVTILLTPADLKAFKDTDNITDKELEKLAAKLDFKENRFGM